MGGGPGGLQAEVTAAGPGTADTSCRCTEESTLPGCNSQATSKLCKGNFDFYKISAKSCD